MNVDVGIMETIRKSQMEKFQVFHSSKALRWQSLRMQ